MIRLIGKIPRRLFIAVSGGSDSMVALDFLRNGRHNPVVIHFDHGTEFGTKCRKFVRQYCRANGITLMISKIGRKKLPFESTEEYWRKERYQFFDQIPGKIITAHNLMDVAEWYLFSSLHGQAKLIPYQRGNVIRPFLMASKKEILAWAKRKNVPYLDDPGNKDEKYMRSIVRHKLMGPALQINPGFHTVIAKKIAADNGIRY
jgi:tRNA(Ile)-lysidine synthase